jgi:replicative DNA helicase
MTKEIKPRKFSDIVKTIDETKKQIEILPTGLMQIDGLLEGGFLKKELIILGGGTGQGKSLFGGTIFYNVAKKGFKSAYFSLEISNEMIVSRLLGARSNISPTKIMIKMLAESDEKLKQEAEVELSVFEDLMFFYDDLYQLAQIAEEIKKHKFDFVVIDFIQNVMTKHNEEYERMSFVALQLQKIAKENNCCILALSQLSNQMSRDKRNKDIVEYKGSGSIGTVADLGFFIEKSNEENVAQIRLRKNRRGISGEAFKFRIKSPGGLILDY